ncbi:hypothetical protein CARUB_v10021737mg [Capsella rubella]|uniref:Knottin scorpion toxin-like domain-containing protein n=1 Tax=Capsella rubella TaxID=81985 RepID=R0GEZ2_9BRAS|nr:hypothetical protein CARUB_v10021737mg [Capsella rubella]
MAITMKSSITFVFTIFIIISMVHCRMTTTPGYGMLYDQVKCSQGYEPCRDHVSGDVSCTIDCKNDKFEFGVKFDYGVCSRDGGCCCHRDIPPKMN